MRRRKTTPPSGPSDRGVRRWLRHPGRRSMPTEPPDAAWPRLSFKAWEETGRTLHLWTQVVGKVRLALTPWLNHSWQSPLYVSPRGLTTGLVFHGTRAFEI